MDKQHLTLREGELDSRLRDRDRTIEDLNLRLHELTGLLRKEQATHELLAREIAERQTTNKGVHKKRRAASSPIGKRKTKSTRSAKSKMPRTRRRRRLKAK